MSQRIPETPEARRARDKQRLTAHRGLATWGEKLVPIGTFRDAVARAGQHLDADQRQTAVEAFRAPQEKEDVPVEGPYRSVAVFGGVYSNLQGLVAVLEDARRRGAEAVYCLGDLGGFGPHPERIWPVLVDHDVRTIQGNYEASLASGREDCNCGYADPRDNHFAELSYRYTEANCSPAFRAWMGTLPAHRRVRVGRRELLLVHGSPRRINEFLFDSGTPDPYLELLLHQQGCDGILCTHTGLHWHRRLPGGGDVVNVGVIGRPANDGRQDVWYSLLEAEADGGLGVQLLPLPYDHEGLVADMRAETLPEPFIETVITGWWTTCLEILPSKERASSRF